MPAFEFLRRFAIDQRGSLALTLALSAAAIVGAAGAAVDFAHLHASKSTVQSALDAAVLGGARALVSNPGNTSGALKAARDIFVANLASDDLTDTSGVTFALTASKDGIIGGGEASMATAFMSLFGVARMPFPVHSQAVAGASAPVGNLEISLMLDVTGSMCDDGEGPCTSAAKLSSLKTAANQLVDTVVWQDQSKYTSKIAVVPFSTRVRVEPDGQAGPLMQALTGLNKTWSGWYHECVNSTGGGSSETGGNWTCLQYQNQNVSNWQLMPCVTERYFTSGDSFDLTDAAPGPGAWMNAHDGSRMPVSADSANTPATSQTGTSSADPADHWNYEPGGACADIGNSDQILPLTNDRTALHARIGGLEAYGSTAGILGTAFSWYMLSPNWSAIWTGASTPQPYALLSQTNASGAPVLRKVAILMTDGGYNTYHSWKDQDVQTVSNTAIATCNAMKAKGVEIYTVGFDLGSVPQSEKDIATATLQACGSGIDHFYQSLNAQQLNAAFQSIASRVANAGIRLVN